MFFNKYLRNFNAPVNIALKPFEFGIDVLTRPRSFSSQKPNKTYSRDELREASEVHEGQDPGVLTKARLIEIESRIQDEFKMKPRIALEYEVSFRQENGAPIKLSRKEREELSELIKKEQPSFQAISSHSTMYEFKFDTASDFDISKILADLEQFKKNLPSYINKIKGFDIRVNDKPYQGDLGKNNFVHTNTSKLHVNLSLLNEDGVNVFMQDRQLLEATAAELADLQLPSFALSSGPEGLDRIHKGAASTDLIKTAENSKTAGNSKLEKVTVAAAANAASLLALIYADTGAFFSEPVSSFSLFAPLLLTVLFTKRTSGANSSISLRTISKNRLVAALQKMYKRNAGSKEATRLENRIHAGDQDPALAILNTLYPCYQALKTDSPKLSLNKRSLIPSNAEEILSHAIQAKEKLVEMYGEELFNVLMKKAIDDFLPALESELV